jgi:hypothetical protein
VRHSRQGRQTIGVENFIARQIRNGDAEQIVEGPRNVMHFEDAGELCDGFLEGLNVAANMTLQLHGGKDREGLTENRRVDIGAIASNDSALFQVSLTALATRRREADDLGKFDARFSCVSLQGVQDFLVKWISFAGFMHIDSSVRPISGNFGPQVRIFFASVKATHGRAMR